ncbi:MAG: molecular chaperone HtpG [Candidatus Puniceispirillaceae bacterium]
MSAPMHQFEADTGKILDIVINSLYSNKEIFLRELISNASDALDKRTYLSATDSALLAEDQLGITLAVNAKAKTLTISDNGIGLSHDDLISSLGTIARSGSKAFVEQLAQSADTSDKKSDDTLSLIGQFGVGFYSAFMVADKVEVLSLKAGETQAHLWSSDGVSGYDISPTEKPSAGTDITLYLKKDCKDFLEEQRIGYLVKKYSDHLSYPVMWQPVNVDDARQLNTGSAIWTRQKSDISDDDYTQFYRQIGAGYDEPFMTLHNRTEGALNYTSLLFIPSQRPMDLFNPDRKSRMQLYINKVFITDECEEFVPPWLRFVKGVIDTPDLDLNVSREMLQHNPAVVKIGKAVVKRILSELDKKKKKDFEAYQQFWEQFGIVLKEGLYEDIDNRDKLLGLCLFTSARTGAQISLQEYCDNMSETQDKIYFLSAESVAQAETSPHLEGYRARDIDVLLLTDPVDEFWVQAVGSFDEKPLTSISRGSQNLDDIAPKKDEVDDQKSENQDEEFAPLIASLKSKLGEQVKDVRLSKTLVDSPACLVADDDGMDIQMERLMKAHNKDFVGMPRVLELNADHKLIQAISEKLAHDADPELVQDACLMLFDQAQILEGKSPDSLTEFARRMTRLMERGLAG